MCPHTYLFQQLVLRGILFHVVQFSCQLCLSLQVLKEYFLFRNSECCYSVFIMSSEPLLRNLWIWFWGTGHFWLTHGAASEKEILCGLSAIFQCHALQCSGWRAYRPLSKYKNLDKDVLDMPFSPVSQPINTTCPRITTECCMLFSALMFEYKWPLPARFRCQGLYILLLMYVVASQE